MFGMRQAWSERPSALIAEVANIQAEQRVRLAEFEQPGDCSFNGGSVAMKNRNEASDGDASPPDRE